MTVHARMAVSAKMWAPISNATACQVILEKTVKMVK